MRSCKTDERGCVRGEARQERLLARRRARGAKTSSSRGDAARTTRGSRSIVGSRDPFHRLAVFDPSLTEAGYGEASSDGCWVAALRLPPPPEEQQPYARAIEFPPDGAAVALDWIGLEAPDPLASCPGYARPVGLPITLQIGPAGGHETHRAFVDAKTASRSSIARSTRRAIAIRTRPRRNTATGICATPVRW